MEKNWILNKVLPLQSTGVGLVMISTVEINECPVPKENKKMTEDDVSIRSLSIRSLIFPRDVCSTAKPKNCPHVNFYFQF